MKFTPHAPKERKQRFLFRLFGFNFCEKKEKLKKEFSLRFLSNYPGKLIFKGRKISILSREGMQREFGTRNRIRDNRDGLKSRFAGSFLLLFLIAQFPTNSRQTRNKYPFPFLPAYLVPRSAGSASKHSFSALL